MQRRSDNHKYSISATKLDEQFNRQNALKIAKRNYTMVSFADQKQKSMNLQNLHFFDFNPLKASTSIANKLVQQLINGLDKDINQIQNQNVIKNSIKSINNFLHILQDPEKDFVDMAKIPQKQPLRNNTDPIGGFNKEYFIKKSSFQYQTQLQSIKQQSQANIQIPKKLPPLMKQLSQQKFKNTFVPLQQIISETKKFSMENEDSMRQRLIRQIQNKRFKEKIQNMAITQPNFTQQNNNSSHNKSKISFDINTNSNNVRQDWNFDYDGSKILVSNLGKVKSNLNILKTQYKFPKQRIDEKKTNPAPKKILDKIDYVSRISKNNIQINTKTISDFGNVNQSIMLKEHIQGQLRKTNAKFFQRQFNSKKDQLKKNSARKQQSKK